MRSLFLKIFMWFWLAMLLLGGAIVWTTALLGSSERPPLVEHALHEFEEEASEAQQAFHDQGIQGLEIWMKENSPSHAHIYLITPQGRDLFGKQIPPYIYRIAMMGGSPQAYWNNGADKQNDRQGKWGWDNNKQSNNDAGRWAGRRHIISEQRIVPGKGTFSFVAAFVPPNPVWHLFTLNRVIIVLLISGLVCWVMARYLTAPLARLSATARSFSHGELDARVGNNITRRGDEIGALGRDFDDMATHLQSLLVAQQRLLRDVSHELRSPLARLQVALGLARQRKHKNENIDNELDRIEREAERLNDMIGQILTLTKLSGLNQLPQEDVRLDDMIKTITDDAAFEAQQQDKHIEIESCDAITLSGNQSLLHSAFENIVRNALRHTDINTPVEVSLHREGDHAVFTVRDHGSGIDEKHLSRIFDAFYRVEDARDRSSGGYGLGLAIAKRAVDLHGGIIIARNADGGGLVVEIRLPV